MSWDTSVTTTRAYVIGINWGNSDYATGTCPRCEAIISTGARISGSCPRCGQPYKIIITESYGPEIRWSRYNWRKL